ncbi:MAG: hypothetical protein HZB09_02060 [Candidatus Yonathbacteria bacterium]|nr:hypothetical protein [Candidatus Yonathbacteria bacterium]
MSKRSYPTSLFIFILAILTLQYSATYFYWYWRIWWFDMPMHFAGGLWVGLSTLWLVFLSGRFKKTIPQNAISVFTVGVLFVFAIAIVWEIFEYAVQIFFPHGTPYDMLDTLSDIFWGLMGGVAASFSFLRKRYLEK